MKAIYKISLKTLIPFLLAGCIAPHPKAVPPSEPIQFSGTVEKLCAGCDIADLVTGGALEWDVLTVRIDEPVDFYGAVISIKVLLGENEPRQRNTYPVSGRIKFSANKAAIDEGRIMLNPSDISRM